MYNRSMGPKGSNTFYRFTSARNLEIALLKGLSLPQNSFLVFYSRSAGNVNIVKCRNNNLIKETIPIGRLHSIDWSHMEMIIDFILS